MAVLYNSDRGEYSVSSSTVNPPGVPVNNAPILKKEPFSLLFDAPNQTKTIDLDDYIEDPDGDSMSFSIDTTGLDAAVATGVALAANTNVLSVTSAMVGKTSLTVTANDGVTTAGTVKNGTSDFTLSIDVSYAGAENPPDQKPAAPTVGTVTATTAPISWAAIAGANFYEVEYRRTTPSGQDWSSVGEPIAGTAYGITGLHDATAHETRIRAVNSATTNNGRGPWSDSATFTTAALTLLTVAIPDVPENTAVDSSIAAPFGNPADSLTLQYSLADTTDGSGDAAFFAVDNSGAVTLAQALNYEAKTSHAVTLKVVNPGTASEVTKDLTITVANVVELPAKPAAPTVAIDSTTSVTVSWMAPATTSNDAATSYKVRYKTRSSSTWIEEAGPSNLQLALTALGVGTAV